MQRRFNVEKAELEDISSSEVAERLMVELGPRSSQNIVAGHAKNNTRGTLILLAITSWNGSFLSEPPASVGDRELIVFSQNGSRGALIYGEQASTTNAAAYLLAWAFIDNNRRVYVKCGPLSEVHYNGWETAALASLNSSGIGSSASDTYTSSSAEARIYEDVGPIPLSSVAASFN